MEETRRRAEDTEKCPLCGTGFFTRDILSGTEVCNNCGTQKKNSPSPITTVQMHRIKMRRQRTRVETATERNLAFAISEIERLSAETELSPSLIEETISIYRRSIGKKLGRGRSTDLMIASSIYAACRQKSYPKTLDEVSEVCGISKKDLGRTYRTVSRTLRLDNMPASPKKYAERYCMDLELGENVRNYAFDLLDRMSEKGGLSGLGPTGIAAASVYISANLYGERISQSEISKIAEISEVTLRSRYKSLIDALGLRSIF